MKGVTLKSVIAAAIMAAGLAWLTGFTFKLGDVESLLSGLWGQMVTAAALTIIWAWLGPPIIKRSAVWSGLALAAMVLMLLRQMGILSMSDEWMTVLSITAAASISVYTGNRWLGKQSSPDPMPGSSERVSGDFPGL